MKMKYITPNTEQVKVQLTDGFLEDEVVFGDQSDRSNFSLGKEQDDLFDIGGDSFGDTWSDPNADDNAFDLWGE